VKQNSVIGAVRKIRPQSGGGSLSNADKGVLQMRTSNFSCKTQDNSKIMVRPHG